MTAYWITVAFLFGFLARDCWQDWLDQRTTRDADDHYDDNVRVLGGGER